MSDEKTSGESHDAAELGEQSSYEGETEMQSRILRGDESKGDPASRDVAGATHLKDTEEGRTDRDTTARDREEK
jgi:hypothetical protein